MAELVVVDEYIFEKQGWKYVLGSPGGQGWADVLKVTPGQVAPNDQGEVVFDDWEPVFEVRLTHPVNVDGDVPDCVGLALRRVSDRLYEVGVDGSYGSDDNEKRWVEGVSEPMVHDGALMLWLDTDGSGFSRQMIEAMGSVFVEELTPCGVRVEVSAGTSRPAHFKRWMSSAERNSEGREELLP